MLTCWSGISPGASEHPLDTRRIGGSKENGEACRRSTGRMIEPDPAGVVPCASPFSPQVQAIDTAATRAPETLRSGCLCRQPVLAPGSESSDGSRAGLSTRRAGCLRRARRLPGPPLGYGGAGRSQALGRPIPWRTCENARANRIDIQTTLTAVALPRWTRGRFCLGKSAKNSSQYA
jgi:hypothetical protein